MYKLGLALCDHNARVQCTEHTHTHTHTQVHYSPTPKEKPYMKTDDNQRDHLLINSDDPVCVYSLESKQNQFIQYTHTHLLQHCGTIPWRTSTNKKREECKRKHTAT